MNTRKYYEGQWQMYMAPVMFGEVCNVLDDYEAQLAERDKRIAEMELMVSDDYLGEECKACSNRADADGEIEHSYGCLMVRETGGGYSSGHVPPSLKVQLARASERAEFFQVRYQQSDKRIRELEAQIVEWMEAENAKHKPTFEVGQKVEYGHYDDAVVKAVRTVYDLQIVDGGSTYGVAAENIRLPQPKVTKDDVIAAVERWAVSSNNVQSGEDLLDTFTAYCKQTEEAK